MANATDTVDGIVGIAGTDQTRLLASLSHDQRQRLILRSNRRAVIPLLVHFGFIAILWWCVLKQVPWWQMLILPLGIAMVFLFTLLHETSHRTVFRTKRVNVAISWVCALIVILPPNWFRYFHYEHHRYTQDPMRDPELQTAKPESTGQYIWHLTGLSVWYGQFKVLVSNARGNCTDTFVPAGADSIVVNESRLMLVTYITLVGAAGFTGHIELVVLWVTALMLGQPFLRLYLMAEHSGCALVDKIFENTRTTFTNRVVRGLAWNMPFHAEHHAYPNVPFYNLPEFHRLVKDRLVVTSEGYLEFHREVLEAFKLDSD